MSYKWEAIAQDLTEERDRLRKALEEIDEECKQTNGGEGAALPFTVRLWDIARNALKETT